MKEFLSTLRGAVFSTIILGIVCCGIYPMVVLGLGRALFRSQSEGSLIIDSKGVVRGSSLIGQNFSGEKYFHSRPSAAGNGYDATSSGGSNLGPTSQKLADSIKQNVSDYRADNNMASNAPVPADAVTASASGLDPHITVANAEIQASRVARVRGMSVADVLTLVHQYTDPAGLGFLGDPGVNVLRLNLALDGTK
jgi:K+-transporting ATPase ATPase C chain